jgi:N-sulfoglucosamine sulfohydrolase
LQGRSLLPVMRREVEDVNDAIFAELTYHAAYEPVRAVRTERWKYIRRFGDRLRPVLPNTDDSPTKDLLLAEGWGDLELPREALHDLRFDPVEAQNLIDAPHCAEIARELRARLDAWMRETEDPLLDGPVPAPEGAEVNSPDQISPAEPVGEHVLDPAGSVH